MGTNHNATIDDLIYAAWNRLKPRLEDKPALLAQRLQRRRTPTLMRPPRAWCIAIRASDHRLLSTLYPAHSPFNDPQFDPDDHTLTLTTSVLQSIIAPITLTAPGETLTDTAAKLGTSTTGLLSIRLSQTVRTHHIPPTAYKGHPKPLLYIEHPLDPCAKGFRPQDALWSWTSTFLATRIPERFEQTLRRVAVYRAHVPRHRYDEFAHPELDDAPRHKSKRLPKPLIEPTCWYKWSAAGYFLGTDPTNWRKNFQDPGNRPPRNRPTPWRDRPRKPKPSASAGSLHFNGYQWLCPACGKTCRTIYLPVPPINLLHRAQPRLAQCVDIPKSKIAGTFACFRCHKLTRFSRVDRNGWNRLISYITGGLLYGYEVPRPANFVAERKRAYAPQISRAPSARRAQVLERLLRGWSYDAIAADLRIGYSTVHGHVKIIYKQHAVHTRAALARKMNRTLPHRESMKRETVRRLLQTGNSWKWIAAQSGLTWCAVHGHVKGIRREEKALRDQTMTSARTA